MAKTADLKVQGQTSAGAAIATQAVELHSDGSIRFTNAAGRKVCINPTNDLNELLKVLFTGTGGVTKVWFGVR